MKKAITLKVLDFDKRSITEPTGENIIKGAKDAFVENLRTNTATTRRKIRTQNLIIEQVKVGRQVQTNIAVVYMKNIANQYIIEETKRRLAGIETDSIQQVGVIEENLQDTKYTTFPQLIYTVRPDKFSANIMEGRVGVLIDGFPISFILPGTLNTFLQAPEDYAQNFIISSISRFMRYLLAFVTLFLPGFYVSITTFHHEMIPTELALAITASKEGVPFPSFVEVLIMLLAFEVILEAGIRLPKSIGQAVTIVGAIVVGDAAVLAKLVSPAVVVIIAITAIASFTMPSQDLSNALRLWRFVIVIVCSIIGLFGLSLAGLLLINHLANMEVYGIPYLSPFVGQEGKQLKDSLFRFPFSAFRKRPISLKTKKEKRIGRSMNNKKSLIFIVIPITMLLLSGCKLSFLGRSEIKDIEFIRAIGVDKCTEKDDQVRLTIATQRIQSESNGGGSVKKSNIIISEGRTVFEAVRNFWNHMDKRPFWGHVEYVLIGEEAAKSGLLKYLDLFSRDPEIRLNFKVFVTKGSTAEEVMSYGGSENRFIFDQLKGIIENQPGQSIINAVDLVEVMYILDKEYLCLYLPCVELQKKTKPNPQDDTKDIAMSGFALFLIDNLAEYLDKEMSRGLNWLRNKIKSGVIVVKSPNDNNISLEIIESNVKLKPIISNDNLTVEVNGYISVNIAEIRTSEDVFTEETLRFLEKELEKTVRNEIEAVIHFGQEKSMDFFGTGDAVFMKYPIKWEDVYERKWKTVFPEILFSVNITPVITGTYNISQPVRIEAGEKP